MYCNNILSLLYVLYLHNSHCCFVYTYTCMYVDQECIVYITKKKILSTLLVNITQYVNMFFIILYCRLKCFFLGILIVLKIK